MPIYEYRCLDCGKKFESLQKFNDEPFTNCGQGNVECATKGSGTVERLMSAPSFQFKGTGFYITDYKKESVSKPAGGGAGASGSSEGKSESKSEPKTESKSETKSESKSESKTESKPAVTKSSESSSSSKKDSKT